MKAAPPAEVAQAEALVATGEWLRGQGYRFVTPTPATHARVLARDPQAPARDLRGIFGWSRAFEPSLLPPELVARLQAAELLQESESEHGLLRSRVRFSSLAGELFAHSAYPTCEADAVFFGPDTYRFAQLIAHELRQQPLQGGARILDVGCGAGPGGLVAAKEAADARPQLLLADINPAALRHASANAALAGVSDVQFALGDLYGAAQGEFDLIVSNPPYLNDPGERTYRHGGGDWGEGLSGRIVREGLLRLSPGGRLVLYTGVAIVDGEDPFLAGMTPVLAEQGWPWSYRELDPDVFGEELDEPAYRGAERIAAVALVVQRPRPRPWPFMPAMA